MTLINHEMLNASADTELRSQRSAPTEMLSHDRERVELGNVRTLAFYLEIPFRHKALILTFLAGGLLLGWIAICLLPRVYSSESRLVLRVGRESVSLDPTATTGQTMQLLKTHEEEIVTALEVLGSRQIATHVVDELGAGQILAGRVRNDTEGGSLNVENGGEGFTGLIKSAVASVKEGLFEALLAAGIKDQISEQELAILQVMGSVDVYSPKRSTVICIRATASTPGMAQAISVAVTNAFLHEHIKGAHVEGAFEFFAVQTESVESELKELIETRAKYMQEHQIISLQDNRELLRTQLANVDEELFLALGGLKQATAQVEDLESRLSISPNEILAEKTAGADPTWSGMRQTIYELELVEQDLSAGLTDDHPRLKRARAQLLGAKQILREVESERVDNLMTVNPTRVGLEEVLQQEGTLTVGLRSLIDEKYSQRRGLEANLLELLGHERYLVQIDRDISAKEANLISLREKLEEARVIEGLHDMKLTNANVFQPATFSERPVSPNKKMLLAAFLAIGIASGLVLAVTRESSASTLRSPEDAAHFVGMFGTLTAPFVRGMHPLEDTGREAFQHSSVVLLNALLDSSNDVGGRGITVGVLGADSGVGASSMAAHLAMTADLDFQLRVVLVDADAQRKSVSKILGIQGTPGFCELLSGDASHDECLQKTTRSEVEILAASKGKQLAGSAVDGAEISQALDAYLTDCDLMIVDLPPANQPDQMARLAKHLDHVILVAEADRTPITAVQRSVSRLCHGQAKVAGLVLTKTRCYLPKFLRLLIADPC